MPTWTDADEASRAAQVEKADVPPNVKEYMNEGEDVSDAEVNTGLVGRLPDQAVSDARKAEDDAARGQPQRDDELNRAIWSTKDREPWAQLINYSHPPVVDAMTEARINGYDWGEIHSFMDGKRQEAEDAGYDDHEIDAFLGYSAPDFNGVRGAAARNLTLAGAFSNPQPRNPTENLELSQPPYHFREPDPHATVDEESVLNAPNPGSDALDYESERMHKFSPGRFEERDQPINDDMWNKVIENDSNPERGA